MVKSRQTGESRVHARRAQITPKVYLHFEKKKLYWEHIFLRDTFRIRFLLCEQAFQHGVGKREGHIPHILKISCF